MPPSGLVFDDSGIVTESPRSKLCQPPDPNRYARHCKIETANEGIPAAQIAGSDRVPSARVSGAPFTKPDRFN